MGTLSTADKEMGYTDSDNRDRHEQIRVGTDGDLFGRGEPQLTPALVAADRAAIQLAIGRKHEHHKARVHFADERLRSAGQWRAASPSRLFAREDRIVAEHGE